jgi:hypothetical protein
MQAEVRASEWDSTRVEYRGQSITYVYRRSRASPQWRPWVVVAPSAIMAQLNLNGLGLYAARSFKKDDYIGQYSRHRVVNEYPTRNAAMTAPETRRLLMRGHDKLLAVRKSNGPGFLLLDGEGGGPPYVERVNDSRNTRFQRNAVLTDAGWLRIVHSRVPAFDLEKSVEENIYSELRVDYQDEYWDLMDALGNTAEYAIEVD